MSEMHSSGSTIGGGREVLEGPFLGYKDVPKDPRENVKFRKEILQAVKQKGIAEGVKEVCRRDILFWVNTFLWTFDPRKTLEGESPDIPFVTWPFQDEAILTLQRSIGRTDVIVPKSRDMGASWMCLLVYLHQCQFLVGRSFMVVSRKEDLVDASGDPDSLFWKLDYLLECQPPFLRPKTRRVQMHLEFPETKCTIDGASTTGDVGRGGRRTSILVDEFGAFEAADSHAVNAATADNTRSRLWNSTFKGTTGEFYQQWQRDDIVKIPLHWTLHPEKAEGLYHDHKGRPRSPWYDAQCKRIIVPGLIAQEIDMDPEGSSGPFFPLDLIKRLLGEARSPFQTGFLDHSEPRFRDHEKGDLSLWTFLLTSGRPPQDDYGVGADVSAGTGATPSVFSVQNKRTGEKVAELANANLDPAHFGELAVSLCRWFYDAELIWEMNGPGGTFGKKVIDLGYRNVYWRKNEQSLMGKVQPQMTPGWHAGPQNKLDVLSGYSAALGNGQFVNYSRKALEECKLYTFGKNGYPENPKAHSARETDASSAGQNHADRVIADALCCKLRGAVTTIPEEQSLELDPPVGSFAWRRLQRQTTERQKRDWSPTPETWNQVSPSRW